MQGGYGWGWRGVGWGRLLQEAPGLGWMEPSSLGREGGYGQRWGLWAESGVWGAVC